MNKRNTLDGCSERNGASPRASATARGRRASRSRGRHAAALAGGLLLLLPAIAQAQAIPRLAVSTTSDVAAAPGIPYIADGDVVAVGDAAPIVGKLVEGHWLATVGFFPGDIDAFGHRPNAVPGHEASVSFSLLSNEGGMLDGDILGIGNRGGIYCLIPEADLLTALGLPAENIDVDALDYDDQGRLLFSLQTDLDGTVLGKVEDGDVLRLELDGTLTRWIDEPGVNACFAAATGLTSSINDVLGLDWVNGELWVSVQSPSSHDGGVLGCGAVPVMIAEEDAVGLGGAELDALSFLDPTFELPSISVAPRSLAPGGGFQAAFHGAPNSTYLVLMSGGVGYYPFPHPGGFGGWYLDPNDPWLTQFWNVPAPALVRTDASGSFQTSYAVPAGTLYGPGWGSGEGWTFQMVDLRSMQLSAPLRIEKL